MRNKKCVNVLDFGSGFIQLANFFWFTCKKQLRKKLAKSKNIWILGRNSFIWIPYTPNDMQLQWNHSLRVPINRKICTMCLQFEVKCWSVYTDFHMCLFVCICVYVNIFRLHFSLVGFFSSALCSSFLLLFLFTLASLFV